MENKTDFRHSNCWPVNAVWSFLFSFLLLKHQTTVKMSLLHPSQMCGHLNKKCGIAKRNHSTKVHQYFFDKQPLFPDTTLLFGVVLLPPIYLHMRSGHGIRLQPNLLPFLYLELLPNKKVNRDTCERHLSH
ncbi:hypothetical protein D3C86_1653470 [compost metagenome]